MDSARALALRELFAGTGWVERTLHLGRALQRAPHQAGGLLVVGTPTEEPWHLTAHLDDEARWSRLPNLRPTLVRWQVPPQAPAQLAIGLERLEQVGRGETVFVVAPDDATAPLLERVADARRIGATVFALERGDAELEGLAHESLAVPADSEAGLLVPDFDVASHFVSTAAGEPVGRQGRQGRQGRFGALRDRLTQLLDTVSD